MRYLGNSNKFGERKMASLNIIDRRCTHQNQLRKQDRLHVQKRAKYRERKKNAKYNITGMVILIIAIAITLIATK